MKAKICKSKDFIAGLVFIFFGVVAICLSRAYPMGTTWRMGPGYFPTLVGGALAILGFVISARSLRNLGDPVRLATLRPLIVISGAVVGFALLLKTLGVVLALFVLILVSYLGGSRFRLGEFAILYLLLVLIVVTFFVYGLGLQFRLWPGT